MSNILARHVAPWALAWVLGTPLAQAAGGVLPESAVAAPFARYQGWRDEPVLDWREANERVGEVGGWRTYLREAHQPDADPGPAEHRHPTTPPASPGR